jgi:hypothetical protein
VSAGAAARQNPAEKAESSIACGRAGRSPLAQLLHALNQPLTGLQCSLEVTLARSRSAEQYVQSLRDSLVLTERMRALVEAIREVAETQEEGAVPDAAEAQAGDWQSWLAGAVEDLRPVADMKSVQLLAEIPAVAAPSSTPRRSPWREGIFRTLDSTLAMAENGSVLRVEAGARRQQPEQKNQNWFCIAWKPSPAQARLPISRPELGLLVAQARLERMGVVWERETTENGEKLTVRMPGGPELARPPE